MQYDLPGNAAVWPQFRQAMIEHEIRPGTWFTDAWKVVQTPLDAMFTVAEIESEGDRQGALSASGLPPVPKAVLMNGTAFTDSNGVPIPANASPLIAAGWKCLVEAYAGGETAPPPQMMNLARQLGWPRSQPVFGIHDKPLAYYEPWMSGGWGAYLGEYDERLTS